MSVGFAYPSSGRLTPSFLEKPPLLCCWSSRGMWTGAGLNAHLRSGPSEHCTTLESDGFGSGHANRSEPRRLDLRTPTRKYEKVPLDLLSSELGPYFGILLYPEKRGIQKRAERERIRSNSDDII